MPESEALEHARPKQSPEPASKARETPTLARVRASIDKWEKGRSAGATRQKTKLEEHRLGAGAGATFGLSLVWGIASATILGWPLSLAALAWLGSALGGVILWILIASFSGRPHGTSFRDKLEALAPWLTMSAAEAGIAWLITDDLRFTAVVGTFALLMSVFLWPRKTVRRSETRFPLGLPETAAGLVREIPAELPEAVASAVDDALEDFEHLREALETLHPGVDVESIEVTQNAEVTLFAVLRQAARAARLDEIAKKRADDPEAERARTAAVDRLKELGGLLHEAASAALRLAATGDVEETKRLEQSVSRLRATAAAQEELSQLVKG